MARVKSQNETLEMLRPGIPEKEIKGFSVRKRRYPKNK
jgi:hypothetical protein